MTPTFREYDLWSQRTQILKSRCHTKRRIGTATRAHPSFGMTTTKTLRSVFSWCASLIQLTVHCCGNFHQNFNAGWHHCTGYYIFYIEAHYKNDQELVPKYPSDGIIVHQHFFCISTAVFAALGRMHCSQSLYKKVWPWTFDFYSQIYPAQNAIVKISFFFFFFFFFAKVSSIYVLWWNNIKPVKSPKKQ